MFICDKDEHCIDCPKNYENEECEHWVEVVPIDDIYRFTNKTPPIEQFQLVDDIKCGLCPYCNEGVNEEMNFCSNCGQRLDWSDE